jgi:hypothetical protein
MQEWSHLSIGIRADECELVAMVPVGGHRGWQASNIWQDVRLSFTDLQNWRGSQYHEPSEQAEPKATPIRCVVVDEASVSNTASILMDSSSKNASPEDQGRLAIPNRPGGGGKKITAATAAMVLAVQQERVSFDGLRRMKQKELKGLYPKAERTTLTTAREAALSRLVAAGYYDKAAT